MVSGEAEKRRRGPSRLPVFLFFIPLSAASAACATTPPTTNGAATTTATTVGTATPDETSGDFVVTADGGARQLPNAPPRGDTYVYLARRTLAVVGLAEARGLGTADAKAMVSRIADMLDACVVDAGQRTGRAPSGVARLVVQLAADGSVEGTKLTIPDGGSGAVLAIGLRCLEAPVKLMSFPPSTAARRGFAIETKWGI